MLAANSIIAAITQDLTRVGRGHQDKMKMADNLGCHVEHTYLRLTLFNPEELARRTLRVADWAGQGC